MFFFFISNNRDSGEYFILLEIFFELRGLFPYKLDPNLFKEKRTNSIFLRKLSSIQKY